MTEWSSNVCIHDLFHRADNIAYLLVCIAEVMARPLDKIQQVLRHLAIGVNVSMQLEWSAQLVWEETVLVTVIGSLSAWLKGSHWTETLPRSLEIYGKQQNKPY
jgi:hypothetical protein